MLKTIRLFKLLISTIFKVNYNNVVYYNNNNNTNKMLKN